MLEKAIGAFDLGKLLRFTHYIYIMACTDTAGPNVLPKNQNDDRRKGIWISIDFQAYSLHKNLDHYRLHTKAKCF